MRKIKWGVLGTAGIFAGRTAEGMRQAENCQLYAIAGRSLEKAKGFQEKFGFDMAYGSYEDLLADPQVEAVYIPLPNTLHAEWTIKALQAKKHVLCEKPLAANEEEAKTMFAAAKENGVLLMEAFAYQHSPYIAAVAEAVHSGVIGDVRYMESCFLTSDYNPQNIRMRRDTLGGTTYDLGVYSASLTQRILGAEPKDVQAIATFSPDHIDLLCTAILTYESGAVAKVESGMVLATDKDSDSHRFAIHGTLGSIQGVDFTFNGCGELSYRLQTFDGRDELVTVSVPQNYRLEVEQLGRCIADGESPAVTEEFSMAMARTIDRILTAIGY